MCSLFFYPTFLQVTYSTSKSTFFKKAPYNSEIHLPCLDKSVNAPLSIIIGSDNPTKIDSFRIKIDKKIDFNFKKFRK